MTAIGVWLGVEVTAARRQGAIVAEIARLGGAVRYDWELDDNDNETLAKNPPGPKWLRRLIGDDYFQTVIAVFITDAPSLKDEHLPAVEQLPDVRMLALGGTQISDASLPQLSRMKRLRFLDVSETKVTDAGMASIAQLTALKTLWVGTWAAPPERSLTDAGIKQLTPLINIETLHVAGNGITDDSVPVFEKFKKLRELYFIHTTETAAGRERLAKSLPNCEVMHGEP